ncbi:MAG: hypothetical protein ACRCRZ_02445 [Metamycoplasmataceae bacterium]
MILNININSDIDNWKKQFPNEKNFFKKLLKNNLDEKNPFFQKIELKDNYFISEIGIGYNRFNKLTIKSMAKSFIELMDNKNIDILLANDSTLSTFLLKEIASFLSSQNIKITAFKNFTNFDKKFTCKIVTKLSLDAAIFIETNTFDNKLFNLYFINNLGENFDHSFLEKLIKKTYQNDLFSITNKNIFNIDFLSNTKIIDEYVSKVLSIETRVNDQKKIKISIVNYNEGLTLILKKIFGKMDYFYIIDNKIKNKSFYQKNKKNHEKIFFKKNILNAKRKGCDLLIASLPNSTQLFLFYIHKNTVIQLNSENLSLIFINQFISDLKRNNSNISNSYISTDILPSDPILKVIKKYNLKLFLHDYPLLNNNEYLLYHWNSNDQYVFGENKIIDYSFHHLIVKILEILNYFKTQKTNVFNEQKKLFKIYGNYERIKFYFFNDPNKTISYFKSIFETKKIKKIKIKKIIFNNVTNFLDEEYKLITIELFNGIILTIKYNTVLRKNIFIYKILNDNSILLSNFNKSNNYKKCLKITKIISKEINDFKIND